MTLKGNGFVDLLRQMVERMHAMLKFLEKLFIKTPREYDDPATRRAYGVLCGA